MKEIELLDAINMAISGYLFRGGQIDIVPEMLKSIAKEYEEAIVKETEK